MHSHGGLGAERRLVSSSHVWTVVCGCAPLEDGILYHPQTNTTLTKNQPHHKHWRDRPAQRKRGRDALLQAAIVSDRLLAPLAKMRGTSTTTLFALLAVPALAQRGRNDIGRIIAAYKPHRKHPELFDGTKGWERWVHKPLLEAIANGQLTGSRTEVDKLITEEVEGVYSFQLMSDEFCDKFLEELDNYYATGLPVYRPNSMNNCACARRTHLHSPSQSMSHRC